MKTLDIISLARKAIKSNTLRANLTIAIIAIGITALIGIITIIEVLKGSIMTNFSSMGSNTFNISTQSMVSNSKKHGKRKRATQNEVITPIKLEDAERFRSLYQFPASVSINIMVNGNAIVKRNQKKSNPNVIVLAADENYLKVSGTGLAAGRNFNSMDVNSGANSCILGNGLATKYFGKAALAENGILYVGNTPYRVLGVMESKGASLINRTDNMVLVGLQNARRNFNMNQKSCVISVMVPDIKFMDLACDEAEAVMRTARKLRPEEMPNFSVNRNDEIANSLIENSKYITLSASLIGFITLLGAAIGLMNIMLVSVAERTREIGLAKAIGANASTIKLQFLLESVIISLQGGLIGICIGVVIGNLLSLVFKAPFVIPWLWIGLGLSICLVVGLAAGIYPALKAGKLNPINALRYE